MSERGQTTVIGGITTGVPTTYALHADSIAGVQPLDTQKGVFPPQSICDALAVPLFAQPDPTDDEIAQYGDADAVPEMKTYAIIDAAKIAQGREIIETSDLPYRCLLKGDVAEELGDVLPYLVELDQEARFTRVLFTHAPDVPDDMATMHLCHKEPGIYIRTRASFDDLWGQLRKFTRVQDEAGKWYFFRFWEGRNLAGVLGAMDDQQLRSFFKHTSRVVTVHRAGGAWVSDVFSLQAN